MLPRREHALYDTEEKGQQEQRQAGLGRARRPGEGLYEAAEDEWITEPALGPEEIFEQAFSDVFCDLEYGGV